MTGLRLCEMGWFVAFSRSPPYPSVTVIPLQIEMRFIPEQYPMPFDSPGARNRIPCYLLRMVWVDTDQPPPLADNRLRMSSAVEKGPRIVNQ
ncbi:hypothetical protein TNCV_222891 [Trichonephila clavipes]|nr:hypothetical protein TNCV_222891 [Trichonephila clavipes]